MAASGVYVGTSSWKYEGWLGQIYTPENYMRYFKQGPPNWPRADLKRPASQSTRRPLRQFVSTRAFISFSSAAWLDGYFSQLPSDFQLSLKVTEDITVAAVSKPAAVWKETTATNARKTGRLGGKQSRSDLAAHKRISACPIRPFGSSAGKCSWT
ncbi:MAG: hypothetical protein WDO13_18325 [Verrucomicrobiota bacterium]